MSMTTEQLARAFRYRKGSILPVARREPGRGAAG